MMNGASSSAPMVSMAASLHGCVVGAPKVMPATGLGESFAFPDTVLSN